MGLRRDDANYFAQLTRAQRQILVDGSGAVGSGVELAHRWSIGSKRWIGGKAISMIDRNTPKVVEPRNVYS
jgi:hypothetical protein